MGCFGKVRWGIKEIGYLVGLLGEPGLKAKGRVPRRGIKKEKGLTQDGGLLKFSPLT